jgi:ribulose-phosphate 3-epimerase
LPPVRIAPSILAGDLGNLKGAIAGAVEADADQIHLDVIDGHFAPNITFGPGTVKALRRSCDLPFDVHLMIDEPLRYVDKFVEAGSDILTFHAEALNGRSFDSLHAAVRSRRRKIGLALKPSTALPRWAKERLDKLDVIIVMTVNPGFSGQALDRRVLPKLEKIATLLNEKRAQADVEVDGGVEIDNAGELVKKGANVLVAGAAVYGKSDPVGAIKKLRTVANDAKRMR